MPPSNAPSCPCGCAKEHLQSFLPLAAFRAIGHEQEFFAAERNCLGAANLGQSQRFLLDGQLFVVECATRQGCQVIRALDGVVAGEEALLCHGLALEVGFRNPDFRIEHTRPFIAHFPFQLVVMAVCDVPEASAGAAETEQRLVVAPLMVGDLLLDVFIFSANRLTQGLRQTLFEIIERCRQKIGDDLGAVLVRIHFTQGRDLGGDMDGKAQRELLRGQPVVIRCGPLIVQV